jgi:large subunit ribosomal protein L13
MVTYERLLRTHPDRAIEEAVKGMLPKNTLGRRLLRRLKVYAGAAHPHAAQRPQAVKREGAPAERLR